jgi:hypothetical protein
MEATRSGGERLLSARGVIVAGIYAVLDLADMGFSSVAFMLGIGEANPAVAWLAGRGLFVPAKIGLAGLAAALIVWVYPRPCGRRVAWAALLLRAAVDVYHVWGLSML